MRPRRVRTSVSLGMNRTVPSTDSCPPGQAGLGGQSQAATAAVERVRPAPTAALEKAAETRAQAQVERQQLRPAADGLQGRRVDIRLHHGSDKRRPNAQVAAAGGRIDPREPGFGGRDDGDGGECPVGLGTSDRAAWCAPATAQRQRWGIHRSRLGGLASPGRSRGDPGGAGLVKRVGWRYASTQPSPQHSGQMTLPGANSGCPAHLHATAEAGRTGSSSRNSG